MKWLTTHVIYYTVLTGNSNHASSNLNQLKPVGFVKPVAKPKPKQEESNEIAGDGIGLIICILLFIQTVNYFFYGNYKYKIQKYLMYYK